MPCTTILVDVYKRQGLTKTMAPRREDTIVKEELPHVSGDIADFHRNVAAVIRDGACLLYTSRCV